MNSASTRRAVLVVGRILAFSVAALSSSVRDDVDSTTVGVALAVIVAFAAMSSRLAGLLTASVAALAFNFFHVEPVHSFRIDRTRDVIFVGLLLATGWLVSDITS